MKIFLAALLLPISASAVGTDMVPVLKCPAVPEAYSKMMTSLKVLQTQIKKDTSGNCDPVKQEVKSLESLLTDRRKQVTDLIAKSKETPLTEAEQAIVRDYVNDATTKVINTADLLDRSNQCFDEDRQKFGFADLAAITLDATAMAKAVAGPWSAPIALGGQALAGIFQGLEKVVKNKRGYDFSKIEQRESFVQSLCSYYNYRQDMNALMFPSRRASELRRLENEIRRNLLDMTSNCPECQSIVDSVERQDSIEANRVANDADRNYVRPLGSYTVQSMSAIAWVRRESQRIREETGDEFGIGRDLLSEKVADLDKFFYEKSLPDFLYAQANKSSDLFWGFSRYVNSEGRAIINSAGSYVDISNVKTWGVNEAQLLESVTLLREPLASKDASSIVYRIDDYERKALDYLDRTALALQVQESYCRFVQKAGYYNRNVQVYCEGSQATSVRKNLARLETPKSEMAPQAPGISGDAIRQELNSIIRPQGTTEEVGGNWEDSLSKFVIQIQRDPNRYQRREGR
jgi:hypothetical protein